MFFLAQRRLFPSFQLFSEGNQFSRKCCKECKPPDRRRRGACKLALCEKGRQSMTRISKHISTMESRRFSSLLSSLRTEHFFHHEKSHSCHPPPPTFTPLSHVKSWKQFRAFSLSSPALAVPHILLRYPVQQTFVEWMSYDFTSASSEATMLCCWWKTESAIEFSSRIFTLFLSQNSRPAARANGKLAAFSAAFQNLLLFNFHHSLTRERKAFSLKDFSFVLEVYEARYSEVFICYLLF